MGLNEIRAGALALSEEERAQLADELMQSLHPSGMDPDELDEAVTARASSVRQGSAVLHDIAVATETLANMLAERQH
jgi:hypothetical protein